MRVKSSCKRRSSSAAHEVFTVCRHWTPLSTYVPSYVIITTALSYCILRMKQWKLCDITQAVSATSTTYIFCSAGDWWATSEAFTIYLSPSIFFYSFFSLLLLFFSGHKIFNAQKEHHSQNVYSSLYWGFGLQTLLLYGSGKLGLDCWCVLKTLLLLAYVVPSRDKLL